MNCFFHFIVADVIKIFHELLHVVRNGSRLKAECFVFMFEDDRLKFKS